MEMFLKLPERFTPRSIARFQKEVAQITDDARIIIDFGPDRDFPPSAMLLIYAALNQLISSREADRVGISNHHNHHYAAHMGLFRLLGFDYGRNAEEDPTTANYIPLQRICVADWTNDMKLYGLSQHVDEKCRGLSSVLSRGLGRDEEELLHYNIRELVRNVFEHSDAQEIVVTAQYWPKLRKASVGLLDNGVGLLPTVSRNPIIPVATDQQAIEAALLPGVTGSNRWRMNDVWDNTGYGLFMTSEICRQQGCFFIASGSAASELREQHAHNTEFQVNGTFIAMDFILDKALRFESFLTTMAARGEEAARIRFGASARPASRSSKGS